MRSNSGVLALGLGVLMSLNAALTIVYVPGKLENGIYTRPHFRTSAEEPRDKSWLGTLSDKGGEARAEKAPPPAAGTHDRPTLPDGQQQH